MAVSPKIHPTTPAGLRRQFWLLHTLGWLGYGALHYLSALSYGKHWSYFVVSLASAAMGFVLTLGLRAAWKRFWGAPPGWLATAVAVGVLVVSTIWAVAYVEVATPYCLWLHPANECVMKAPWGYVGYIGSLLYVCLSWTGLYLGIKYYRQMRQQTEQTLRANATAHQAQLKMLRYQLNPHFLFNTLNTLAGLIVLGRKEESERIVLDLSRFLRHTLAKTPTELVPLADEVGVLRMYLDIERARFHDRLQVSYDVPEECGRALVPSLVLLPFAENSIKHALGNSEDGIHIRVGARREGGMLRVWLEDGGRGESHAPDGLGIGLSNVRQQLQALYGPQGRLRAGPTGDGWRNEIAIPWQEAAKA